jgi:hypothetical protein
MLSQGYSSATDSFDGGSTKLIHFEVVDSSAFTFNWSDNDQTVTATFRPGYKLPTDKDYSKLPQYAIGFRGGIRDAAGSGTRSSQFFRVSPAQSGRNGYTFTVAADTTWPRLINVIAINNSPDNGGRDVLRLTFTETMTIFPGGVAAPMGVSPQGIPAIDDPSRSAITSALLGYRVSTTRPDPGTLLSDGGTAVYWNGDPTHSTVVWNLSSSSAFNQGDTVWVGVKNTVEDPAGNAVDTTNSANVRSATAI